MQSAVQVTPVIPSTSAEIRALNRRPPFVGERPQTLVAYAPNSLGVTNNIRHEILWDVTARELPAAGRCTALGRGAFQAQNPIG